LVLPLRAAAVTSDREIEPLLKAAGDLYISSYGLAERVASASSEMVELISRAAASGSRPSLLPYQYLPGAFRWEKLVSNGRT
jgi:hypothetical protein